MRDFKELRVWSKAHALTIAVYKMTQRLPKEELFGLTSQMRRCPSSIGANIAEGAGASLTESYRDSCTLREGRLPSWSTIFCFRMTWDFCRSRITNC